MPESNPVIKTIYGDVEGLTDGKVSKWLGIPFAKPPIGELRFHRAQEPDGWDGVKPCKKYGNSPYQFVPDVPGSMPQAPMFAPESEDCLYLNVYAPADPSAAPIGGYPVFVWAYGGANHMGEAANPDYDLSSFAHDGVIGVSFNYRLGPLGFYDFRDLGERFETNCALSDMIAALKWVKANIEAFGGNPDNVTICGESAGGAQTWACLASPYAKGLFSKAIPMSGLAGNTTTKLTHELNMGLFFDAAHLDPNDGDALFNAPIEQLIPGGAAVMTQNDVEHSGIFISGHVIDDDMLPGTVWDCMANGGADGVDVIVGTCRDEGRMFSLGKMAPYSWERVKMMLDANGYGDRFEQMKSLYAKEGESEIDSVCELTRDRMFWVDAQKCALAQTSHGKVWQYRFDYAPIGAQKIGLFATHSMDIQPALDTYSNDPNPMNFYYGSPEEEKAKVRDQLHGAFVQFCKTGDPNGAGLVEWPRFEDDTRKSITVDLEPTVLEDPYRDRFEAWKDISLYM